MRSYYFLKLKANLYSIVLVLAHEKKCLLIKIASHFFTLLFLSLHVTINI
jgi:hypothetical protein